MTFMTANERAARDWDSLQFRVIFATCLPGCFFTAAARRLSPTFWQDASSRRPIFAEAREAAGTIARFALAG